MSLIEINSKFFSKDIRQMSNAVALSPPEVEEGEILHSSLCAYVVLDFVGEGSFGKVAECLNLVTKETVAVKILRTNTEFIQDTQKEMSKLEMIRVLDPDRSNIVKFYEQFNHLGHTCLVFEMLDKSLYDLLYEHDWTPVSLAEIRPIVQQLLVALNALKSLGVMHADIKPDNIMLVNMRDKPLRIKLIDFGEAMPASEVKPGLIVQPVGYRAPEVSLGLPFSEAVDVWGVGCILAFLYLKDNLFPVYCDYQAMRCMVEILGQPEDHMLWAGKYTHRFFMEDEAIDGQKWTLMTPDEYSATNNVPPEECQSSIPFSSSLDGLVDIYVKEDAAEYEDRMAFVDLLKQLLHLDGTQRVSPQEALQHPFLTLAHLSQDPNCSTYVKASQLLMKICPVEDAKDVMDTCSACPPAAEEEKKEDGELALEELEELAKEEEERERPRKNEEEELGVCLTAMSMAPAPQEEGHDGQCVSLAEDSASQFLCVNDDEPAVGSSDRAELLPDSTKAPPPCDHKKMLKRICKFARQIISAFSIFSRPKVDN